MKGRIVDKRLKTQDSSLKSCVLRLASCVLVCVFLAGCAEDEDLYVPNAKDFVDEGWAEYTSGNYQDAIARFQKALDLEPDNSEAYNGVGWSMARQGRVRDSIESFKEAVKKDPANIDAYMGLAGAYLADGDYERAIASAKAGLAQSPEYISNHDNVRAFDVHVLLAECYYISGDYTEAMAQVDLLGGAGKHLDTASPDYVKELLLVINELGSDGKLSFTNWPK